MKERGVNGTITIALSPTEGEGNYLKRCRRIISCRGFRGVPHPN
jgi:hypothetical protein